MTLFNPESALEDHARITHQTESSFCFNHSFEHLIYVQFTLTQLSLTNPALESLTSVINSDEWARLKAIVFTSHLVSTPHDHFIDLITVLSIQLQLVSEMGLSLTLPLLKEIRAILIKLRQCIYPVNNVVHDQYSMAC